MAFEGEWLYLGEWGDDIPIFRMRTHGSSPEKLIGDGNRFSVFGDWIYCYRNSGGIFRMRIDGSDLERLH